MITISFKDYVKNKEAFREGSMDYDIATGLRNIMANARENPYKVLGDGLKWALESAQEQKDEGGVQMIRELQDLSVSFFQRIRNFMQHRSSGNGVQDAIAPRQGQRGFEEYQREWLRFTQQFSDQVQQYSQAQSAAFANQHGQHFGSQQMPAQSPAGV